MKIAKKINHWMMPWLKYFHKWFMIYIVHKFYNFLAVMLARKAIQLTIQIISRRFWQQRKVHYCETNASVSLHEQIHCKANERQKQSNKLSPLTMKGKYHGLGMPNSPGRTFSTYHVKIKLSRETKSNMPKTWAIVKESWRYAFVAMLLHCKPEPKKGISLEMQFLK